MRIHYACCQPAPSFSCRRTAARWSTDGHDLSPFPCRTACTRPASVSDCSIMGIFRREYKDGRVVYHPVTQQAGKNCCYTVFVVSMCSNAFNVRRSRHRFILFSAWQPSHTNCMCTYETIQRIHCDLHLAQHRLRSRDPCVPNNTAEMAQRQNPARRCSQQAQAPVRRRSPEPARLLEPAFLGSKASAE
ncbi:hypothetical protein OH77DRAFT_1181162 [Trametes cingulata]|nr:hypothetical protein OH77DRAFT_1181162 [Trametes cingulata]